MNSLAHRLPLAMLAVMAIAQLACAGHARATPPDLGYELRVINYCEYSGGTGCQPIDDAPAGTVFEPITWCCDYETGDCVAVVNILACDPGGEYAVICEWGASVEQSSPIGSIDCYD